jgi:tripartite-type tricarboxylate transporter receptor subunit TctC
MIKALKIFLALFLVCAGGCALAQNAYPAKPIRFIVPFGPGGVTDVLARLLAAEMQKDWGQPVVVVNMAGATGTIGSSAVAKAAPDGYTILITSNVHTINLAMRKEMPFDTLRDFTPITLLTTAPNMLVVRADSPIKSVADYVAAALAKPGEIAYATAGVGTAPHIAGEQFSQITGTRYNLIPYSSSIQSIQSVVAGETVSAWSAVNAALPLIKAGRIRALAVASDARSVFAPEVPTFVELGVKGMRSELWLGALAPANLPAPIAVKLSEKFVQLINRADMKERILNLGSEPLGIGMDKFGDRIRDEIKMYIDVVRAAGIKPE